jgi:hypothetical protein
MYIAKKSPASIVASLLIVTMAINLASCGTILHPERRNQPASGNIDAGIAVLDGIGLLFFIVPGVIAFAVDFSNNSIYLPRGHAKSKFSEIQIDKKLDEVTIENIVHAETGKTINLQQSNVGIIKLDSAADLASKFALFSNNNRIASAY